MALGRSSTAYGGNQPTGRFDFWVTTSGGANSDPPTWGCHISPIKGRTRGAAIGPLATLAVALRASTNTLCLPYQMAHSTQLLVSKVQSSKIQPNFDTLPIARIYYRF